MANHNMGQTLLPHDTPAVASDYRRNPPQAQREEAHRKEEEGATAPSPPTPHSLNQPPHLPPQRAHIPKFTRTSVFGIREIPHTSQLKEGLDTVDLKVTNTQMIINGLPPSKRRSGEWKEDLAEAFNQKAGELEFRQEINLTRVNTVASYQPEVWLTVRHRQGLLGKDPLKSMTLQQEIAAMGLPRVSLARDSTDLVIPNLNLTERTKPQQAADNICRTIGLEPTARPAKWLTSHRDREGYQKKATSLRFSVSTESLRRLNQAIPIPVPDTKAKLFLYRRTDDEAYYVGEAGYTVREPRPSESPEAVKMWTICTYCNRGGHEEEICYIKKNDQRRGTARTNV